MKLYELSCLISSDLPEEEVKKIQEKVNNFIIDGQGALDRIENIGKKRLGTAIKGQSSAYLATLSFYLKPEKLAELNAKLRSEEAIVNFLVVNKKPFKMAEAPRRIRHLSETSTPKEVKEKTKKVEIKEIEKKLEEILGE